MINLHQNFDLTQYTTIKVPARAKFFAEINTSSELLKILNFVTTHHLELFILGEGSNTIFTRDFPGVVAKISLKGMEILEGNDQNIILEIAAGENWHDLVTFAVNHQWAGIENLALIPGTVGAAPVQNIAAYGQNFSDVFDSLQAVTIKTGQPTTLSHDSCHFGYRDSIFKNQLKNQLVITKVRLKLHKKAALETSYYSIGGRYDSLESELSSIASPPYNIKDVYQAVINIRSRKLLDPALAPTVGSFFVNPVINLNQFRQLQSKISNLQFYPLDNLTYRSQHLTDLTETNYVKIPAGRLIDHLGWRGKTIGNCQVSHKLASIITHNGHATGQELINFADQIRSDVKHHFDIDLQTEVNII